ncbi:unnamed protein product [Bemisia tabaci]|uniref:Uncharacterized protein n=1 Tax=Bemisia tabaci TaxID=7038 RepID=A0A9P0A9W3_BEMTA|nr:PREDICTED: uncharacterized protein LOC109035464 isoform X2 [Bemisia tabaci]CAH0388704.1 unnamed protein product [Bemisia tabaci]
MSWKRSRLEPRWSLLLLSLLQATRGSFGDEKGGSGSSGGGSMSSGAETSHMSSSMEQTPEQAYFNLIMKQKYDADKKDMMAAHAHAAHTHPHPHTDMMKMGNKEMRKPSKITSTRKGRGKKGDKKMQMMYLGLMYIKSVIQMVMMAIGQVLQFKSVVISLVSVMIQFGQFILAVKKYLAQKHKMEVHLPHPPASVEYHEKFPPPTGHPDDKYPYPPSQGWNSYS